MNFHFSSGNQGQKPASSVRSRKLRFEHLESRELLAVTATDIGLLQQAYPNLDSEVHFSSNSNYIEVSTLTEANLRNAIAQAKATAGADVIVVRTTSSSHTVVLTQELAIHDFVGTGNDLTIVSLGSTNLTLNGNSKYRGLSIKDTNVNVGGVNVIKGKVTGGSPVSPYGAGILAYGNTASFILENCSITNCTANNGGGGVYTTGDLKLYNTTISGNSTGSHGGGLYVGPRGTATITDSTLSTNTATGSGGGIHGELNSNKITITNSTISGNKTTLAGGGIFVNHALTLENSVISNNTGGTLGGGIRYNAGELTLNQCQVTGNKTSQDGGGISGVGKLTVMYSTISGNSTNSSGGGISNTVNQITIKNSIISDNTAKLYGGGIRGEKISVENSLISGNKTTSSTAKYAQGGGIYLAEDGKLDLTNNTIAGNSASGEGGGVYVSLTGSYGWAKFYNNIVAGNTAPKGPDVLSKSSVQGSYNLIGKNSPSGTSWDMTGLTNGVSGNKVGTVASPINPLYVNAGAKNYRLQATSPAVNAGSNSYARGDDLDGANRIHNGTVDMGAYEYGSPIAPAASAPAPMALAFALDTNEFDMLFSENPFDEDHVAIVEDFASQTRHQKTKVFDSALLQYLEEERA